MTYKELQQALRLYKEEGQTQITLNSPKPILEAEFERLTVAKTEETEPEAIETEEVETVFNPVKGVVAIESPSGERIPGPWSTEDEICSDCNGSGYTNDGGNVFPCWCELGCQIIDAEQEFNQLQSDAHKDYQANPEFYLEGSTPLLPGWQVLEFKGGKISQHEEDTSIFPFDPLEPALKLMDGDNNLEDDDELEDKVDEFLLAVKQQQLSSEQLEAIVLAMVVGHKKHQAMSTVLACYKRFHLFTPNQLLAWGFDQIIPGTGLFQQFRRAIAVSKGLTESEAIPA